MKKTIIQYITTLTLASLMIMPMTSNAVYTVVDDKTGAYSKMTEGYTEIENCHLFDWAASSKGFDHIYVNENGTEFKAFTNLDTIRIVIELAENVDTGTVEKALLDKYGDTYEGVHFHLERNFKTEQTSYFIKLESTPTPVTVKGATEMLEFLKSNGYLSGSQIQTSIMQVQTFDVPGVNYYNVSYYDLETKKYLSNEDRIREYVENNLEGYRVEKVTVDDGNSYYALISPEAPSLIEQIELAEKIYGEIGLNIPALSPSSASNIANSEINVFDAVKGDANCDGRATIADAIAILQHIANRDKYELKTQGAFNADVDGEAGVTANDARVLQEWDANK